MSSRVPRRLLVTIASYAYLEPRFLAASELQAVPVERKWFPDGERYLRLVLGYHACAQCIPARTSARTSSMRSMRMKPARGNSRSSTRKMLAAITVANVSMCSQGAVGAEAML